MERKPLLSLLALTLACAPLSAQSACFDWSPSFAGHGIDLATSANAVYDLLVWDDGSGAGQRLFAGGHFVSIDGVVANHLAAWNGTSWQALGAGLTGFPGYLPFMGGVPTQVESLCLHDDGSGIALYAGGAWTAAGGQACRGLARWDGSAWTGMTPDFEGEVSAMASFDDGSGPALFICGYLYLPGTGAERPMLVLRNGVWEIPAGPPIAHDLAVFDDGSGSKLYAAGSGVAGSPKIARWDGSTWSGVGGGLPGGGGAVALAVHDDGGGPRLYVGGTFTQTANGPAARVAAWDGSSWSAVGAGIGNGVVHALASFPDPFGGPAKLIAVGTFTLAGGAPANGVAAWDGTSWGPLAEGATPLPFALAVYDDHQGSGRDLYVGGAITAAGADAVGGIAKWEGCGGTGIPFCFGDGSLASACPCANAGAQGHGCASSQVAAGGLLVASGAANPDTIVLAASELPAGVSCVFLQGDGVIAAGAPFGDGLRCAAGSLVRLALKSAVGGSASFPEAGDPSITARSAALGAPIPPSSSRSYQVYYRDNDPLFCAAPAGNTWNVTNGMRIHW